MDRVKSNFDNRVKNDGVYCSYKCQYYQDGPVISICNKYSKVLQYMNYKPKIVDECQSVTSNE